MTVYDLVWTASIVAVLATVAWKGDRDERLVAALMLAASFASPLVQDHAFQRPEPGVVLVDVALLLAVGAIAVRGSRIWLLVCTASLANGTLMHVADWLVPGIGAATYGDAAVFWSYPALFSLLGCTLTRRAGAPR